MRLISKIVALFLAGAMLLGGSACARNGGREELSTAATVRTGLEIEETPFEGYTPAEKESYHARLTDIVKRLVYVFDGFVLQGSSLKTVQDKIKDHILPLMEELRITPRQMQDLLSRLEAICANTEEERIQANGTLLPSLFLKIYRQGVDVLGNRRSGSLLFALTNMWLDVQIGICDTRYESYGYQWYLEDGNRYREQKRSLGEELGENAFSMIVSFLFVSVSSLSDSVSAEGGGGVGILNAAEVLTILKLETSYFMEQEITAQQWSLGVNMVCEWLLEDITLPQTVPQVLSAELYALRRDPALFSDAGTVFAALLPLYHEVIHSFDEEDMEVLLSGEKRDQLAVICRGISACEEEFLSFSHHLSTHGARETEAEAEALRKGGLWDAYVSYSEAVTPSDAQALLAAMCAYGETSDDAAYTALMKAAEGYLFDILPYLTFAIVSANA